MGDTLVVVRNAKHGQDVSIRRRHVVRLDGEAALGDELHHVQPHIRVGRHFAQFLAAAVEDFRGDAAEA